MTSGAGRAGRSPGSRRPTDVVARAPGVANARHEVAEADGQQAARMQKPDAEHARRPGGGGRSRPIRQRDPAGDRGDRHGPVRAPTRIVLSSAHLLDRQGDGAVADLLRCGSAATSWAPVICTGASRLADQVGVGVDEDLAISWRRRRRCRASWSTWARTSVGRRRPSVAAVASAATVAISVADAGVAQHDVGARSPLRAVSNATRCRNQPPAARAQAEGGDEEEQAGQASTHRGESRGVRP